MDGILTGSTIPGLGGPESNANDCVFHILQTLRLESYNQMLFRFGLVSLHINLGRLFNAKAIVQAELVVLFNP